MLFRKDNEIDQQLNVRRVVLVILDGNGGPQDLLTCILCQCHGYFIVSQQLIIEGWDEVRMCDWKLVAVSRALVSGYGRLIGGCGVT